MEDLNTLCIAWKQSLLVNSMAAGGKPVQPTLMQQALTFSCANKRAGWEGDLDFSTSFESHLRIFKNFILLITLLALKQLALATTAAYSPKQLIK